MECIISTDVMTLDKFGKIFKLVSITAVALAFGLLAGRYLQAYTRADATGVTPSAQTDTSAEPAPAPSSAFSDTQVSAEKQRQVLSDKDFDRMTQEMRKAAKRFPGSVGIYFKDLSGGREWMYNPNQLMPSASLVKVPVMVGVYDKISKGELSLDQILTLTKETRKSGSGHLKWRKNGEQFTVRELLEQMMAYSDNIAQEMLIHEVGLKYLQEKFPALGLSSTNITRQGLSLAHYTAVENYTTAREMGQLLENIYNGKKFGKEASAQMIELMKGAKYNDRLPRYLPKGWVIAHKTGLLRRACHDCGIVYSPAGTYIICVLTSSGPSYRDSKRFISKVAAVSFRIFESANPSVAATSGLPSRSTLNHSF